MAADWKTPTDTMIAAMQEVDDAEACVIAFRHKDGGFTYFVPADQHPVDSLGLVEMTKETLRWEMQETLHRHEG